MRAFLEESDTIDEPKSGLNYPTTFHFNLERKDRDQVFFEVNEFRKCYLKTAPPCTSGGETNTVRSNRKESTTTGGPFRVCPFRLEEVKGINRTAL